jgi:N-acyl-L-homoserine lactone synthetase
MHAERKRVFVDIMRWNLSHDGCHEHDRFDDDDAQYIVLRDNETGDHLASLRLLRTDRPHLMSEVFPFLCEREVPAHPGIREITRFCLSPKLRAPQRLRARNTLVRGMVEFGLMNGLTAYTAVCEMGFLSQVLSAGWEVNPLGMPQFVEGQMVGAFQITLNANTLSKMVASWQCAEPALSVVELEPAVAA